MLISVVRFSVRLLGRKFNNNFEAIKLKNAVNRAKMEIQKGTYGKSNEQLSRLSWPLSYLINII